MGSGTSQFVMSLSLIMLILILSNYTKYNYRKEQHRNKIFDNS